MSVSLGAGISSGCLIAAGVFGAVTVAQPPSTDARIVRSAKAEQPATSLADANGAAATGWKQDGVVSAIVDDALRLTIFKDGQSHGWVQGKPDIEGSTATIGSSSRFVSHGAAASKTENPLMRNWGKTTKIAPAPTPARGYSSATPTKASSGTIADRLDEAGRFTFTKLGRPAWLEKLTLSKNAQRESIARDKANRMLALAAKARGQR